MISVIDMILTDKNKSPRLLGLFCHKFKQLNLYLTALQTFIV